jgi:hypothetical protein
LLPGPLSVSLTQLGGSGTLVAFEPSNIAGATSRDAFRSLRPNDWHFAGNGGLQ